MFFEHYNSQLNRLIQSTNYQFSTMKYINSILKHHKTRKMKSDLTENERRQYIYGTSINKKRFTFYFYYLKKEI